MTWPRFAAQRLAATVLARLGVLALVFVLIRVLPGILAQAALGENASWVAAEALRSRLGLDALDPRT